MAHTQTATNAAQTSPITCAFPVELRSEVSVVTDLLVDCLIGDPALDEAIDVSTNSRSSEFDIATSTLAVNGWCVVSNFLSQTQTQALSTECRAMHDAQLLTPARVGANRAATLLRGDSTRWFQTDALSTPQQAFADRIEALRNALNRELFLGLV